MNRLLLAIAILASASHAVSPRPSENETVITNGTCSYSSKTGPVESKFMIAIWQGNLKTVAQGLSEASNLNVKITIPCDDGGGDYTTTPLLNAIQGGHPEMVEFLLQHGASPDFPDASAPLQMAVSKNDLAAVRLLLRFGAHVGGRQISAPPLLDAVQTRNSSAIVQTLIQAGANIEATDDEDNNALALAALGHNDEAVRSFTMLEKRGQPELSDFSVQSSAHATAR